MINWDGGSIPPIIPHSLLLVTAPGIQYSPSLSSSMNCTDSIPETSSRLLSFLTLEPPTPSHLLPSKRSCGMHPTQRLSLT